MLCFYKACPKKIREYYISYIYIIMYSDIYSKLTPEERKILETYHKKINNSEKKKLSKSKSTKLQKYAGSLTNTSRNHSQTLLKTAKNKGNHDSGLLNSPENKANSVSNRKSSASSKSGRKSFKSQKNQEKNGEENINIQYEIERLLRGLYRHTVICPEFKEEINVIGGLSLLDDYLRYRDLNN